MCSSPYWQVGQSWFREKLSPANREQRLSRWADFAKNCLLRIGSKVLPRFREKYRALGRQKNGVQHATAIYPIPRYTRPRYIGLTLYREWVENRYPNHVVSTAIYSVVWCGRMMPIMTSHVCLQQQLVVTSNFDLILYLSHCKDVCKIIPFILDHIITTVYTLSP